MTDEKDLVPAESYPQTEFDKRLTGIARASQDEDQTGVHSIVLVLDDGKRVQCPFEGTFEAAKAVAKSATEDGYGVTGDDGVYVFYPASRITRVQATEGGK